MMLSLGERLQLFGLVHQLLTFAQAQGRLGMVREAIEEFAACFYDGLPPDFQVSLDKLLHGAYEE